MVYIYATCALAINIINITYIHIGTLKKVNRDITSRLQQLNKSLVHLKNLKFTSSLSCTICCHVEVKHVSGG